MSAGRRTRRWVAALIVALAAVTLGLVAAIPGGGEHRFRLFGEHSFWNRPLGPDARLDPGSGALTAGLAHEVATELRRGRGPWIETDAYSTPIFTVANDAPTVKVKVDGPAPDRLDSLQRAFEHVPVPPGARSAAGTDGHMTIIQPGRDRLWELWRARRLPDGWHASWGGAMAHVSTSPGYFAPSAWPGAEYTWGATGTSLPVVGGTMRVSELRSGRVDHALAISLPGPRRGEFTWPAQRGDGSGRPGALPEGARLRLDPAFDIDGARMPRLTRIIARAAQRYGLVVRDKSDRSVNLYAEDPAPTGRDPYHGRAGFFAGHTPPALLASFPWAHLQLLRMRLCRRAPCPPPG